MLVYHNYNVTNTQTVPLNCVTVQIHEAFRGILYK